MVNQAENIVFAALQNKMSLLEISEQEIDKIIEDYTAFHSAHLFKAFLLNEKNQDRFQNELPIIATNVKNRAILHDFIYEKVSAEENLTDTTIAEEKKETIEEEVLHTDVVETETTIEKPVTDHSEATINSEEEIPEKSIHLIEDKEETQENITVEPIQEEYKEKEEEEKEEKTQETNQEVSEAEAKEIRRKEAMQKLQDELFADKMNTNAAEKDEKRLNAMKQLQEELFQDKKKITKSDKITESPSEPVISKVSEEKPLESEKQEIEAPKEDIKAKADPIIEEPLISPKEEIVEETPIQQEIEKLIKEQEEIVEKIISEENQFEPKEEKLEFIDWLKLKNVSTKSEETVNTEIEEAKIKANKEVSESSDERIPIDPTGMIEAEMHQEIKASTDPLENFISSQIRRKKNKKKINNINTNKTTDKKKPMIVSETLAEILVVQQKYNEAIDVYSLLGLKYPQKSIYFARQIEKIKNYL